VDVRVVLFLVENGSDLNEFRSGIFAAVSHTRHHLPTTEYLMSKDAKMDTARLTLAAGWLDLKIDREMDREVRWRKTPGSGGYHRTP
jgi:hypothetical protein